MSLVKKVAVTVVLSGLGLAAVYSYFQFYTDYYFPDRYEVAFGVFGYAVIGSVVVLLGVIVDHLIRRSRRG